MSPTDQTKVSRLMAALEMFGPPTLEMPIIAAVPASVPVMTAPPVAKPVTRPGGDIYEMSNRLNRQVALKQHVDHTIEWALEALRENDDRDAGLSEALAIITHAAPRFERLGGLAS